MLQQKYTQYTQYKNISKQTLQLVFFVSTYSSPGQRKISVGQFFKAEEFQSFPASTGSNMNDVRKGFPLHPGIIIICKLNWTLGKEDPGLASSNSPNPLGKNDPHGS